MMVVRRTLSFLAGKLPEIVQHAYGAWACAPPELWPAFFFLLLLFFLPLAPLLLL